MIATNVFAVVWQLKTIYFLISIVSKQSDYKDVEKVNVCFTHILWDWKFLTICPLKERNIYAYVWHEI